MAIRAPNVAKSDHHIRVGSRLSRSAAMHLPIPSLLRTVSDATNPRHNKTFRRVKADASDGTLVLSKHCHNGRISLPERLSVVLLRDPPCRVLKGTDQTKTSDESSHHDSCRSVSGAAGECDEVATAGARGVDERARGGRAELQAVARVELVHLVALVEAQVAGEHPDLLVDEPGSCRPGPGPRHPRAARPRRAPAAGRRAGRPRGGRSRSPGPSTRAARPGGRAGGRPARRDRPARTASARARRTGGRAARRSAAPRRARPWRSSPARRRSARRARWWTAPAPRARPARSRPASG